MGNKESLNFFRPEIVLTLVLLLVILLDLMARKQKRTMVLIATVLGAGAALTLAVMGLQTGPAKSLFMGMMAFDDFSTFFKILFLGGLILIAFFSAHTTRKWATGFGEYYALLISCTLGMCLMASATDLLMMYLSLEFVSVTSYILAGFLQKNRKSAEASLKYIIYGAAASGMMLYGISLLYGITGTTSVSEIGKILAGPTMQVHTTLALIVSVLITGGFAYKIAAVPFHMWCPDVYEGSPTPITAFFSIGPKVAGFAMLIRFLMNVYGADSAFQWQILIAMMCLLTMAVGNLTALHQTNLKRLMAYSSIAHAGYMLLAFVVFTPENVASVMFYSAVYLFMNLGAFMVVLILEERYGVETVDGCRGLGWRAPGLCVLMAIFLFSLTGLPPFAGFAGKLLIFGYVIEGKTPMGISLVVAAVIFSVISLYYYARIIAAMFLQKSEGVAEPVKVPALYHILLWAFAIPTVVLGVSWGWLYTFAFDSARQMLK